MLKHASRRRGLVAGAILGLVAGPLTILSSTAPAQAASSTVVINEVYVNGGSSGATYLNKYVELYNRTAGPIDLAGMSVQYRAPTATTVSSASVALTGTIPAHGFYTLQGASNAANGIAVPGVDQTSSLNPGGGGGTISLVTGTTTVDPSTSPSVIDRIGYGTSNTPEGSATGTGPTGTTVVKVLARGATSTDTDVNNVDFTVQDPSPDTVNGSPAVVPLTATDPGDKTVTTGIAITGFTLAGSGGKAPYAWSATGLPTGVSLATDGAVSGTPTTAGVHQLVATVKDSATPTPASASTSFTITVTDPPAASNTIAEVQGTTDTTPFAGQVVTTTGVVIAAYATGGLNGFYLQTGGADTTPNASDAIFVFVGAVLPAGQYPAVGTTVTVTGTAKEFVTDATSLTEIEVTSAGNVATAGVAQAAVVAKTLVPGTDCAQGACATDATLDALRERTEGELFAPAGSYTVTDPYDGSPFPSTSSGNFGEIGLAAESTGPLVQPTELYDAQTQAAQIADRVAYNDAHRIILDDASSLNYTSAVNTGTALPWLTATHYVRVGAAVTFPQPVVLTTGFDGWTLLPSGGRITGDSTGKVDFAQDRPAAPAAVGGDLVLATANVLNYFPTTGNEFVANGLGTCTYYTDRQGNQLTNRSCTNNGPRGAANAVSLQRQQDKIVREINTLGASIVSLEEIENSVQLGKDRDFGVRTLVAALNADAGAGTWAFAPSPSAADLPAPAQQDVIRSAFIYKPGLVALVGPSKVLTTESSDTAPVGAFSNAREPLAQGFKGVGQTDAKAFAVVVNHFKSKGSGADDGTGQGNANPDRISQANALKTFAAGFAADLGGSGAVFLAGDFNAYEQEDPIQVLTSSGYTALSSTTTPGESSYSFSGLSGSLDHVLANPAAEAMVTGVDIWNINADESVYYEYSRFNYNVTDLHTANPFRASDHNPEVIGLALGGAVAPVDVQILATNDFHGRIANDATSASAGAAVMAGAVKQLRATNPNTVFAAAGDLIGASTFESFIAEDKPTIDALNEAGLEVSAVGNHEFDQGYDDLVNRVLAPYDATTNPNGGASWKYLGANVRFKDSGDPALDGTWIKTMDGVQVGFIGAVTEHLPELVSPAGISNIQVTDIATAANAAADDLEASGADVIVLLVHEGAASTDCATIAADTMSDFGRITAGVDDNIDAIVSGHTHLAYDCALPVAGWSTRPVTTRPVVSAGQYGYNLNKLGFTVDPVTGTVQARTQAILPLKAGTTGSTFNYPVDPATKTIVDRAVADAAVLGAQPLGRIGGAFNRAKLANGTTENRGGESTLGNLVAEIQRWATSDPAFGAAQIAFMNPGGLRADLSGQGTSAFPRTVTFKDAANVQPFANTLVNEDLTGAQVKAALEQQWQPAGASRPFLKLGTSRGFTYTYDPTAAQGSRISGMYLNGVEIDPAATYSVTVNSFLATGGDNFTALGQGTGKQDTGRTDLQAQVDYFAAEASGAGGLAVDSGQRAVGAAFPAGAPASYPSGAEVTVDLSSLSMTGPGDPVDTSVEVSLDGSVLGSFPVSTTIQTGTPGFDEAGTATVVATLPTGLAGGAHDLVVTGESTGTVAKVPVRVDVPTVVTGAADQVVYGSAGVVSVTVAPRDGSAVPTGTVELRDGTTLVGSATLAGGGGSITIPALALEVGDHTLDLGYPGDEGFGPATGTVSVTVVRASPLVSARAVPSQVLVKRGTSTIDVEVAATGFVPTGAVEIRSGSTVIGTGTLSDGSASIPAGPWKKVGTYVLTVSYVGDAHARPASDTVTVRVVKRTPTMRVTAPDSVERGDRATVRVVLAGTGGDTGRATGKVTFTYQGDTVTRTLDDGRVQLTTGELRRSVTIKVHYLGNDELDAVTERVTIRIST